jgi:ABC-2 type transport system ATP-binding protein
LASIELEHVSVAFPIFSATNRSVKISLFQGSAGGRIASEPSVGNQVVRALEDVTLSFKHGDRVGLVGHNGAGKTTLLRVLAGIYEPALGRVNIEGSCAPLFDIHLGMDPESTGYDNIILRGLFLGLSRKEIEGRLEEIAEFTELGSFLDLPIRTYSSGMRIRLAFAISTSINPDILLLDEGIGAGDAAFMTKARARMKDFTHRASIIMLASHSDSLIREMCDTAVLMEHGKAVKHGDTEEILALYAETRKQKT